MARQGQLVIDPHSGSRLLPATGLSPSLAEILRDLLQGDLDFAEASDTSGLHNLHAFPAKYPPALPRLFIEHLTQAGEVVLDPMVGSGTTMVEAALLERKGIGSDVDPLALLLSQAKVDPPDPARAFQSGLGVCNRAYMALTRNSERLQQELRQRFDEETRGFLSYWFAPQTQLELMALLLEIEAEPDASIRRFLRLCFSGIIVTKSGGVSLAIDLAHTRPHRVKDKVPRSAIEEFAKRLRKNVASIEQSEQRDGQIAIVYGDARSLPLQDNSIHLVITSPPYAGDAIDYMRAHKFSLVWFGYPVGVLASHRRAYLGSDTLRPAAEEPLPAPVERVITAVGEVDTHKARVLDRYYRDMMLTMREAYRVLQPGRCAIFVVASSRMRGVDTRAGECLGEIAQSVGFRVVGIGTRRIHRDRRMMPVSRHGHSCSGIEQRMHEEYVVGLVK
jgi:hypothetical protein